MGMATPEYMPPEFLEYLAEKDKHMANHKKIEELKTLIKPECIDVWSLGAILLEIFSGVPLWLSLKGRVTYSDKSVFRYGLFGVRGRIYDKIRTK